MSVSIPLIITCDSCLEDSYKETLQVEPTLMKVPSTVPKNNGMTLKRFLTVEYGDLDVFNVPLGWIVVEVDSTIKFYCTSCREKISNEID